MQTFLRAQGLVKAFEDNLVLKGVSLSLEPGTMTALMGRSGSGKTTLLRALAFIEPPDEGSICFLDHQFDYPGRPPAAQQIWPTVTVVFQDLFLWPHLTCLDNIIFPTSKVRGEEGIARANGIIEKLKINHIMSSYPNEASRGQRQLVALARALSLRPSVLLLDEITASLDVETSATVASVLEAERTAGTAIMLITHQFGFARRVADQFAYLHEGVIAEQGPSSILDGPTTSVLREFTDASRVAP